MRLLAPWISQEIDIYHPMQDAFTGSDIAFGGDLARSIRSGQNFLVMETQAQGFPEWTPYPGQIRLQTYSLLACGANMVSYWHWATTNNRVETYWRGLLSQDYSPNPTFREASEVGAELKRIGSELVDLHKINQVAIYFSNRALTGFDSFKFGWMSKVTYNDVLRPFYDSLYRSNVEADLIDPSTSNLSAYKLIVVPALYSASDDEIGRLKSCARGGGHLLLSFKTGFSDENLKVRTTSQPGDFADAVGATYTQFTIPENVSVTGELGGEADNNKVRWWMELLQPTTATVNATYKHPVWGKYAALTRNQYGKGEVAYLGFMPNDELMDKIIADAVNRTGVTHLSEGIRFPIIVRSGLNRKRRAIHYLFNYSAVPQAVTYPFEAGTELLSNAPIPHGARINLSAWGVQIVEDTIPSEAN